MSCPACLKRLANTRLRHSSASQHHTTAVDPVLCWCCAVLRGWETSGRNTSIPRLPEFLRRPSCLQVPSRPVSPDLFCILNCAMFLKDLNLTYKGNRLHFQHT